MRSNLNRMVDVPLRMVAFGTLPGWIQGLLCPSCHEPLKVHQPDGGCPDRMIATCQRCRNWYLLDLPPDRVKAVMVELPGGGFFHDESDRAEGMPSTIPLRR